MEGYFINLDSRKDRLTHIDNLKMKYDYLKNIKRMNAIRKDNGAIGCTLSHIKCLYDLQKKDGDYFIILEDDFDILNHENFIKFQEDFEKIKDKNWDVLILTPRGISVKELYSNFKKIIDNQTTTGYIVKKSFISTLLSVYEDGLKKLMKYNTPLKYALDQYWKPLQKNSNFIYYKYIFGGQLSGYSDIEKTNVNYNMRYLQQNNY